MKNKGDLTFAERLEAGILLEKGYSMRAISKALKRGHNTVSYEVRRNSVSGEYDPHKAEAKARLRKRMRRFQWKKINQVKELREYVISGLKAGWNPDEISGRMKLRKKGFYVSKTAIYDWLYTGRGQPYCKYLYSKRYRRKPRKQKPAKRVMIPNRVGIERRMAGADNRTRYGHVEADTLVSGKRERSRAAVSVICERKSRLIDARKLSSLRPKENTLAIKDMMRGRNVKSATFDNGVENRDHESLEISTFFCEAYSSWQKGGVENANKMLRRYFPKGMDLRRISEKRLAEAVERINNKPRRILGYMKAKEVAVQSGYIKSGSVLIEG
jgi:transposase, IS30 family